MSIENKTRHTVEYGTVTTFAEGFEGWTPTGNFAITVNKVRVKVEYCYLSHPGELSRFKEAMDQAVEKFKEMTQ